MGFVPQGLAEDRLARSPLLLHSYYTENIGSWSVRTLFKLEEVKKEVRRYSIDILGLCETQWEGKGNSTWMVAKWST